MEATLIVDLHDPLVVRGWQSRVQDLVDRLRALINWLLNEQGLLRVLMGSGVLIRLHWLAKHKTRQLLFLFLLQWEGYKLRIRELLEKL
jgi:hypothetical protein